MAFLKVRAAGATLAARRGELTKFQSQLQSGGWRHLPENPQVTVKLIHQQQEHFLLARSRPRRQKERAIRRRQRRGLARGLKRLQQLISTGRLKNRDKILERVGRLTGRYPKARPFATIIVSKAKRAELTLSWNVARSKGRLVGTGPTCSRATNRAGPFRNSGRRTCS